MSHYWIELTASLERTLNYAHTGNARVLTKGLMDPLWLSLSVIHDGLPSISKLVVPSALVVNQVDIHTSGRLANQVRGATDVEQKSHLVNFGDEHYQVR